MLAKHRRVQAGVPTHVAQLVDHGLGPALHPADRGIDRGHPVVIFRMRLCVIQRVPPARSFGDDGHVYFVRTRLQHGNRLVGGHQAIVKQSLVRLVAEGYAILGIRHQLLVQEVPVKMLQLVPAGFVDRPDHVFEANAQAPLRIVFEVLETVRVLPVNDHGIIVDCRPYRGRAVLLAGVIGDQHVVHEVLQVDQPGVSRVVGDPVSLQALRLVIVGVAPVAVDGDAPQVGIHVLAAIDLVAVLFLLNDVVVVLVPTEIVFRVVALDVLLGLVQAPVHAIQV